MDECVHAGNMRSPVVKITNLKVDLKTTGFRNNKFNETQLHAIKVNVNLFDLQ